MKSISDKIAEPFTDNIEEYLVWLARKIGPLADKRQAGLAISLYTWYQKDSEHREKHGLPPL